MIRLICFDLGNVLVKLKDDVACIDDSHAVEYARLTKLYGLGQLQAMEFLSEIKQLFQWPSHLSAIESWFVHHRIEGLQSGAELLLSELHGKGLPIAILSNINASHWMYLSRFDLFKLCRYKLLSYQQFCAKPDVMIYRNLEKFSGCRGEEVMFFDDLEENVQAARHLGWRALKVFPSTAIEAIRDCLRTQGVL